MLFSARRFALVDLRVGLRDARRAREYPWPMPWSVRRSLSLLCHSLSRGGGRGVHRPKRHLGMIVLVVPVPPAVRRGLRIALGRVLPVLLPSERGHVEVAPGAPQRLVAAVVDEVGAEHLVAVAEEHVRAVVLVHAEVGIEIVGNGVPGHRPAHSLFQARPVSWSGAVPGLSSTALEMVL